MERSFSEDVKQQAISVRAALESSGLDHGPISVHDKMRAMGLDPVPSTASLARIFRESGVARLEPRKKPRSSWRRFVYPAPNACWPAPRTGTYTTPTIASGYPPACLVPRPGPTPGTI